MRRGAFSIFLFFFFSVAQISVSYTFRPRNGVSIVRAVSGREHGFFSPETVNWVVFPLCMGRFTWRVFN